ncbi:mpv17-like protein isoform X1 [Nilaparvata lugens]|uniref:mpv17-like protein isoform X1 n=1 Tax=Nilaparvata lugens TaxID=108931 RepID=UPI000B999402|nr:mpv17-like protein isoform X1 [Nilaparvata lugens]
MRLVLQKVKDVSSKYPVIRGMVSYAVIWPIGSLVQQTIAGVDQYDYARAARFCLFGSCYVAPTLHTWLKVAVQMFPKKTLASAFTKGVVEQFTYTPFAMTSFFFGMSILEGRTVERSIQEVKDKFIPTYKVALFVWPVLQTVNHHFVPEKNRVIYVSVCSLMWSSFLAYMKVTPAADIKTKNVAAVQSSTSL